MARIAGLPWGQVTFVFLFGGFFFYHQLLDNGLIPAFLGGYFGMASILVFFVLAPVYILRVLGFSSFKISLNSFDHAFFFLMLMTSLVALVNYLVGRVASNGDVFFWSISGVFFNIVVYLVARCYELSGRNRSVLLVVGTAMLLLVYVNSTDGQLYSSRDFTDENTTTYQGYGRSLVLIGFLLIAYWKNGLATILIAAAIIPALFLNGGRTELVLFIASIFSLWGYLIFHLRYGTLLLFGLLVSLTIFWLYMSPIVQELLPDSRVLELFELSISASAGERERLTQVALRTIYENPVFGDYGSYVLTESGTGFYAHNLLSAWVNLGLTGFLAYCLTMILALIKLATWGGDARVRASGHWRVASLLAIYLSFGYIFSRSYSDEIFGSFVGFFAAFHQSWQATRASQP